MVTVLNSDNYSSEVLSSDIPVLVDFYADWCGPCKMLSPIVEEIAESADGFKVCKMNIDENMDIAMGLKIVSIPTLMVFKNGEVANKVVGLCSKSDILDMLNN